MTDTAADTAAEAAAEPQQPTQGGSWMLDPATGRLTALHQTAPAVGQLAAHAKPQDDQPAAAAAAPTPPAAQPAAKPTEV